MRDDDVAAATRSQVRTFAALDAAEGRPPQEQAEQAEVRARRRVAHLLGTDPEGAVVAERDGAVVGVGLALRRGPVWFLSLLTVDPDLQGAGVGRRLLERCLGTREGAEAAYLCTTQDPRALRRYVRAGFRLQPGLRAAGRVDRSGLPAGTGVREGSWERDAELVDGLVAAQRGAGLLPEVAVLQESGVRPLLVEGPSGRGVVLVRGNGVMWLAADDEAVAVRLLQAALAESAGSAEETEVERLTARQAWAVDVVLDAGLPLLPGGSLAVAAAAGPMAPYLPSAAYG